MKKLIKFKPNAKTYFDIAEDFYDHGDLDSAIHYFFKAYHKNPDINALIAIGETYCEMGQPEEGLKYLSMALDKEPDDTEICHSVAQCFLDMDDEETAFFYFSPRMTVGRFKTLIEETEQESSKNSPKIRVLEKNDDMVVGIAVKLLQSGDLAYAREVLLTVAPDSPQYVSACNLLSLSALELEKPDEALECAQKALAVQENMDSRCNMMLAYFMMGKDDDASRIMEYVEAQKADLAGHKTMSLAYIRMGKADKAAKHLKVLLENSKYNRDALVSYALACYNSGDLQQAKKSIVTACRVYPNDIAAREIAAAISRGDKLSLFPMLEDDVATSWLAQIDMGLTQAQNDDLFFDNDFLDKITWLFQSRFVSRQTRAAITLGRIKSWRKFFLELLLDNYLDLAVKKVCLFSLLLGDLSEDDNGTMHPFAPANPADSTDSTESAKGGLQDIKDHAKAKRGSKIKARQRSAELGIVIDGMYSRLKVRYPQDMDRVFAAAYCLAFASFAFSDSGFEDRLLTSAKKLQKKYNAAVADGAEIGGEDILAAVIFYSAGHDQINGSLSAAHLFGCDHEKLEKLLRLFGIKIN